VISERNNIQVLKYNVVRRIAGSSIFSDYFKIGFIQGLNYLIPLIIIPILVRLIGKENFGLVAYSQAFIAYFLLLINYSFDFTATRDLASLNGEKEKINKLFNEVFQTKLFLFIVSAVLFSVIVFSFPSFKKYALLHIVLFCSNLGWVFNQSWFFQGLRIFRIAVFLNLISKLILAAGVLLFVKHNEDVIKYAVVILISQLLLGVISLGYLVFRYKILWQWQGIVSIRQTLHNGASIFFSNIFTNLSTTSNLFLLSLLSSSMHAVANFAAGSKIIAIVVSIVITSFTISAYPYITKKLAARESDGFLSIQMSAWAALFIGIVVSGLLFLTSESVMLTIYGSEFKDAVTSYRILCFVPIPLFLNNVLSIGGMLNLKMDKMFFRLTAFSSTLSIVLNILLASNYGDKGTATAWLITEIFISIVCLIMVSKKVKLFRLNGLKEFLQLYSIKA
jgi:PST family polysaccharide transporter